MKKRNIIVEKYLKVFPKQLFTLYFNSSVNKFFIYKLVKIILFQNFNNRTICLV